MFFAAGADQLGGLVEDGGEVGVVGGGVGGAAVGDAEGGGVEFGAGGAEGAEEKAAHCAVLWAGVGGDLWRGGESPASVYAPQRANEVTAKCGGGRAESRRCGGGDCYIHYLTRARRWPCLLLIGVRSEAAKLQYRTGQDRTGRARRNTADREQWPNPPSSTRARSSRPLPPRCI